MPTSSAGSALADWIGRRLDRASRELRYAARGLARAPVFTAVAVLSLALGLGAATAIFSLVEGVLLRPLPYREPERLVFVREVVPPLASVYPTLPANVQHFRHWRARARSFDGMAAFVHGAATLTAGPGGGEPEVVDLAQATADLFAVLGVEPRLGRAFHAGEEGPGRNRVVVVTDSLWRRRFGASPNLVGRSIDLDGVPHTVVGILPPSFHFPRKDDLGPLARLGERTEVFRPLGEVHEGWGGDFDYNVFARLKPGLAVAEARAELDLLQRGIDREHDVAAGLAVELQPLREALGAPVRAGLYALLAAVGLLLLIVSANLANLLLARAGVRARELSLRAALGASRAGLVGQVLAETLLLSAAGGLLGVWAAGALLRAFVAAAPVDLPRLDEVGIDGRVLLFALGLSLACALVSGLIPALRTASADPQGTLRAASHTATESRRTLRWRELLVASEVGLSTVLLLLAALLIGSLFQLLRVDKGFRAESAAAVALRLPAASYPAGEAGAPRRAEFFDRALDRVRALPGVLSAGFVSKLPLSGESEVNAVQLLGTDRPAADPATGDHLLINVRFVSDGYFETIGLPLRRGRAIEPGDRERAVTVVSARLAAKLWPGADPLGKRFLTGSGVGEIEVVGVVDDVHNARLEQDPTLIAYVPFWQDGPRSGDLVLRTAVDPASILPAVRRTIWGLDPGLSVPRMRTLSEIVSTSLATRRFQLQLATGFALAALALAAIGIYGVVAYGVAQRRSEIGVRMALGARVAQVARLVLASGLRPVLLGLAAGIAAALAGGRLVAGLLYGISPSDPGTIAAVALLLAGIAGLACLAPALDAARTDPASVLREG